MGEEEQNLDEAIAEIVAVIDDQNKMIGMLINMNNTLDFLNYYRYKPPNFEYHHS